jgi:uncharacterized protein with PIN domain
MPTATFRFYEELNDLLPKQWRKTDFRVPFKDRRSIKDMIESLGVPHTEVDLILADSRSVDFSYILQDGDRISVYPVFESFNIRSATRLRQTPLRKTRFIADADLGPVVRLMRALGFDTYFNPDLNNREIIRIANQEKRILLTRSRNLLKFKDVSHGIFIPPSASRLDQVRRVVERLDIRDQARPFSRCIRCNGALKSVPKEDVLERIPLKTRAFSEAYSVCASCGKLYWNGTHVIRMQAAVDKILGFGHRE